MQEAYEEALDAFKHSLHLKSDYADARLWWDKTAARVGYEGAGEDDADGAYGDTAGDGPEGEEEEEQEEEDDGGRAPAVPQRLAQAHVHSAAPA